MTNRSTRDLTCPLCQNAVSASSSGCLDCHLPITDIRRYDEGAPASRGKRIARAVWIRFTGALLYCGIVAWCAYQLPDTLPFVVPGAVLGGGVLHVWKGRPWLGLLAFAIVVVVVPALFWPSMATGAFSDLADGL